MSFLDVARPPLRRAWRDEIAARAILHGWNVRMLGADWGPDLVLIRRPRMLWIFAEPERGRLSSARLASLLELRSCRQDVAVWRPDGLEKIERTLF